MRKDYHALAIFVSVADAGSFSAAGRRMKLSTSVVSHHIANLENRLGVSLFFRSSRKLSLTPEGHRILDAARRMVDAGNEALDALSDTSDQPVGALRIAMPAFGQHTNLYRAIWQFSSDNPMVSIFVGSSDKQVDLVEGGFDLAIRIGNMPDSSLMTKRICPFHRTLVASPDYLKSRPAIHAPEDLRSCDFVSLSMLPDEITLLQDEQVFTFEPDNVSTEVDTITAAKSAVIAGLGIQHLPDREVVDELSSGSLVEVLPSWQLPVLGIYVVWPENGPQKKLTRRLIDHLAH
ncbi:LysR family transcriptional regulator [Tateyamaria sp. ANG-S1]|uniref:LysR family transcriptional regulator n=1 Tax=Tateyamaria sp. ANG-S1 TaxID=1577905 RepID=UPI00057D694B|nr:LysR family transcriptional regulator [Tateyamaria sp. ANG-S1]KIC51366.1 hypothetical protein RA29_05980 [Tateyamaria sp. ANG-S1]